MPEVVPHKGPAAPAGAGAGTRPWRRTGGGDLKKESGENASQSLSSAVLLFCLKTKKKNIPLGEKCDQMNKGSNDILR